MYISELTMHGFKSFAKKDVVHFGEGITAIVGPNGCGKTNIVDAIRWVLGEQKHSILRSGKKEDIIFNGAKNIKPLSVCEVSLTVHNNKGKLPIEYNDIEIGRRLFRSGESEYFMNRTPCRLKDIHDLFVDTVMGSDAYSVIELKMIEQILSETGDDRRRMFEEASGINKYKIQKKSTLRKFESTRSDLNRVNDLILEIEAKVKSLSLQLKRFERHSKLLDDLKTKEISLAFLQTHNYRSDLHPLKKRIEELNHLRDSNQSEESDIEKKLVSLQKGYKSQQDELDNYRNQLTDYNEKRESLQSDVIIWKEQSRSTHISLDRLNIEQEKNTRKSKELDSHLSDYQKSIKQLKPKIDSCLNLFKKKQIEFNSIDNKLISMQSNLDIIKEKRWEYQKKLSDKKSMYDNAEAIINEKKQNTLELNKKVSVTRKELDGILEDIKKYQSKKKGLLEKIDKNKIILDQNDEELLKLEKEKYDIEANKNRMLSAIDALESKHSFYQELVNGAEGYPKGVRDVLNNKKIYKGSLGTVGDLINIDKSIVASIEIALGEYAKCIITKNQKNAIDILELVRNRKSGRIMVIPLDSIPQVKVVGKSVKSNKNVISRAIDLVKVSSNFKPLVDILLGNFFIVKDVTLAMADSSLKGIDMIGQDGVILIKGMIIDRPSNKKSLGLVGRKEQLHKIKEKIELKKSLHNNLKKELDKIINTKERKEKIINNSKKDSNDLNKSFSEIDNTLDNLNMQRSGLSESVACSDAIISLNQKDVKSQTILRRSLKATIKKEERRLSKYLKEIQNNNEELLKVKSSRDEIRQQLQDARINHLNLEGQRENISFQESTAVETIKEFVSRESEIKNEIKDIKESEKNLRKLVSVAEKKLSDINAMVSKKESILNLKQEAANESYVIIEEMQAQIRSEQKNRESLIEELKNCELKVADLDQRINFVSERIFESYNASIPEDMIVDQTENELNLATERIEKSIENIGPINMAVQVEHEEESERLMMLKDQKDDLIKAEQNLLDTIQEIDKIAREKFQTTFEDIGKNFEKLFTMFFEGGRGSLRLEGDPDPLEANIGIHAQPPGKRNQSLRQLSAGEKALTAIALLFSIYQVKPSPYCILDEVDAPLDDVNIRKFTRVLNNFSNETQFIVVTHNKLTMESANFLYGVTMEKKGVSQLVSVKLD